VALGAAPNRWSVVYAANGTINTSDERVKKSIRDAVLGLDFILKLRPVSFEWKDRQDGRHYGFTAQEVERALEEEEFAGLDKSNPDMWGLNYSELIAPLVRAVQELSAEITELKKQIATK
jgi:hypothetical protein